MTRRFLFICAFLIVLLGACGETSDQPRLAQTTVATTTTEPTTTKAPTTTKPKVDEAARTGCKWLTDAKDNDGIRRAVIAFSYSLNENFADPAHAFIDADNEGDDNAAYSALTDLNIACHAAGLL